MKTLILTLTAALAVLIPAGAATARPSIPTLRVDVQCKSGHNPNCHPVYITRMFPGTDYYRPVGIWIKFK